MAIRAYHERHPNCIAIAKVHDRGTVNPRGARARPAQPDLGRAERVSESLDKVTARHHGHREPEAIGQPPTVDRIQKPAIRRSCLQPV
jgi:hypothetical protein